MAPRLEQSRRKASTDLPPGSDRRSPIRESGRIDSMQIDRVFRLYLFDNLIHEGDIIDVLPIGLSHLVFAAIVPIPSKRLGKDGNEMVGLGDSVKVSQINNGRGAVAGFLGTVENEDDWNRFLQASRHKHSKGAILSPERQRGVAKSSGLKCHWGEQRMNKQDSRAKKRSPP